MADCLQRCACDVPAHTYQFSWAPNTRWSKFYAPAPEILAYLQDVVEKHALRKYMHFRHRAVGADWQEESSTWKVRFEVSDSDGKVQDTFVRECDVLVQGIGTLNSWKWPNVEGLQDYRGTLMHTANWDDSIDLRGKTIAIIGNGASAVQCVPALQPGEFQLEPFEVVTDNCSPVAGKILNYVRTASWQLPHLFSDGDVQKDCWCL